MTLFSNFKRCRICECGKGSIVDTQALLSVIDSGRIKGAALDTYEYERGLFPGDYRGKEIDDVLLKQLIKRYYFNTTYCFLYRSSCQKSHSRCT